MNNKIRLRYAPSPTGFLHIGNTRTALFNYLFAKHYNGAFILRFENTDIERNVDGAIESQLDNLRWLGIEPDETIDKPGNYGPYTQLERLETYKKYADQLLVEKKAYYCFCTSDKLEKYREKKLIKNYVSSKYDHKCYKLTTEEINNKLFANIPKNIRFYVPKNKIYSFNDLVRGHVQFESKDIGDWVIIKSNNIPTYNFAVVIDDILMEISHVVRGEEHISNTPKQLMIYQALQKEAPIFAHLILIINEQYKKLSKRDAHLMQFISQYRELGYLPEAIFNFIVLLGWSPQGEKEIFTHYELIKIFDEQRWSKSPSMFDIKKLTWMNNLYIKNLSDEQYLKFVKPFLFSVYNLKDKTRNWIDMLLLIYKKELRYGQEIIKLVSPFINSIKELSQETLALLNNLTNYKNLIKLFKKEIFNLNNWHEDEIKSIINKLGRDLAIKGKNLFMPIRIFISHKKHGPELIKVIYLLGKDMVIKNIDILLKQNEK